MPVLIYKRTDGTEKTYEVGGKPLIFGRLPEAEIQVRDAFISRIHANIHFANNTFVLKDLGSTNGTYRNGTRVYECELTSGDKIQVGGCRASIRNRNHHRDGRLAAGVRSGNPSAAARQDHRRERAPG